MLKLEPSLFAKVSMADFQSSVQTDIIIVGTGMVGSLLAIALSPFFASIVLLDKLVPDIHRQISIDSRPLSLNLASVEALKQVKLWEILQPYATPIQQVHVSQHGYLGTTQFFAKDYGLDQLGAVVPADVLAIMLLKEALGLPGVRFQKVDELKSIHQENAKVFLNYTIEDKLVNCESRYVFGCDGSHSKVAQCMGFQSKKEGETFFALVCDILHMNLNGIAYERFTAQGTLALLPKINGQTGLVLTGTKNKIDLLEQKDDAAFIRVVQDLMGDRLSPKITVNKRFKKPLENVKHEPIARGQVLLLGNAARTLYPFAAQGFNLGLRDVMQLQAVFEYAHHLTDCNPKDIIQTFLAFREEDQEATSALTSRIGDLFENKYKGFSYLRGLGLMGLDIITPLKSNLAERALGITGRVKRVLKLVSHERA